MWKDSVNSDLKYRYFHRAVKHWQAVSQDSEYQWSAIKNLSQSNSVDQRPKAQPINELIEKILICLYYIYPM